MRCNLATADTSLGSVFRETTMEQAQQQMAPLSVGVEESARILGISRSATYELIAQGEIKTFKIGRRRLALASELKAFIERAAKVGAR